MEKVTLRLNCEEDISVSWGSVMREGKNMSCRGLHSYVHFGSRYFLYFIKILSKAFFYVSYLPKKCIFSDNGYFMVNCKTFSNSNIFFRNLKSDYNNEILICTYNKI